MDEPRTEAGRWLLAIDHEPKGPCFDSPRCDCGQAIAAIERESLRLARDAVAGLLRDVIIDPSDPDPEDVVYLALAAIDRLMDDPA